MPWEIRCSSSSGFSRWRVNAATREEAKLRAELAGLTVSVVLPLRAESANLPVLQEPVPASFADGPNEPSEFPEIVDDSEPEEEFNDVIGARDDAQRAAMLVSARRGFCPRIDSPVALYPGECAHFVFSGISIYQRRHVGNRHEAASSGLTIFDGNMAFSFGASEGRTIPVVRDICLGSGTLVLTSHRLVFASPSFGVSTIWQEVLDYQYDAFTVLVSGSRDAPLSITCDDGEMLATCMSACIHRHR